MSSVESTFRASDGEVLYSKSWTTQGPPKATIIFLHGFDEHCNGHNYNAFFGMLASSGIEVRAFDQRGWGRSANDSKKHGLTGGLPTVMGDVDAFVRHTVSEIQSSPHPTTPVFLMGCSMGGGETLYYALHPDYATSCPYVAGFIGLAPLVRLAPQTKPLSITVAAGKLVARFWPSYRLASPLNIDLMTHDNQANQEFLNDPYSRHTATLGGVAGMFSRSEWLDGPEVVEASKAVAARRPLRVWIAHGDADGINDFHGSKELIEKLDVGEQGEKLLVNYPGGYHKLDTENLDNIGGKLCNDVKSWVLGVVNKESQTKSF